MAPKPSSAASRMVSLGKICFSSHSAANGLMASAVNLRAISWIWSWSSVRSNCVIARRALGGAPHVSKMALLSGFLLEQPFEPKHVAHRGTFEHPFAERLQVRPFVEPERLFRPAGDHEQIDIGNAEPIAHQERTGAELAFDIIQAVAQLVAGELLDLVGRA